MSIASVVTRGFAPGSDGIHLIPTRGYAVGSPVPPGPFTPGTGETSGGDGRAGPMTYEWPANRTRTRREGVYREKDDSILKELAKPKPKPKAKPKKKQKKAAPAPAVKKKRKPATVRVRNTPRIEAEAEAALPVVETVESDVPKRRPRNPYLWLIDADLDLIDMARRD